MIDGQRNYEEKRGFIRMSAGDADIKLFIGGVEYQGICLDLSSNGMQVRGKQTTLAVGDKLKVHLPSVLPQFPPLDVNGEVVRVDNLGGGEQLLGLVTTLA